MTLNQFWKLQPKTFEIYLKAGRLKEQTQDLLISKQTVYLLNMIGGSLSKNWKTINIGDICHIEGYKKTEIIDVLNEPEKAKELVRKIQEKHGSHGGEKLNG